jgi:type III secretion protein U
VFVLVSVLDAAYQRFSFLKRMRMSRRDIRQEYKDSEGDPMMRGQRRQLHQEWSQTQSVMAARDASLLVVNPTHIAIALSYEPETMAPPRVTAKGAGPEAQAMREAGEDARVPIVQNAPLARAIYERVNVLETIPSDMFEAAAEAILLAQKLRAQAAAESAASQSGAQA